VVPRIGGGIDLGRLELFPSGIPGRPIHGGTPPTSWSNPIV
jgi:hypothetical protein